MKYRLPAWTLVGEIALATSLTLLVSGCGEETPEALLASAKDKLNKKDVRGAVIQLKSALQADARLIEARFLLGRTLLDGGDAVAAEVELRKAAAAGYASAAVVPLLAQALVQEGKPARAIEDYGATQLEDPAAASDLKTSLALAYAQQSNPPAARAAIEEALRLAPGRPAALIAQARFDSADRRFDAAMKRLDEALAADPGSYEALQLRGDLLYFTRRDAAGAVRDQRRALELRSDWIPAHVSLIETLLAEHDAKGAQTQLEALRKLLPNHPQTKYLQARLAIEQKDVETARILSQQILGVAPDNVRYLTVAGVAEMQRGSPVQAALLFSKALQQAPDIAQTRLLLARAQLNAGDPDKSRDTLAPLLGGPAPSAAALSLAADAALQLGDPATAGRYYSEAVRLNPADGRARTALALAELDRGHLEVGDAQLQHIAASDRGTDADLALIALRLKERNTAAALKAIDALEQKQPALPDAARIRGQVLAERNDLAGARRAFERALALAPLDFASTVGLADVDMREKKLTDAVKRFDKLLVADPKNVRARIAVAELRGSAGASREEMTQLLTEAIRLSPTAPAPRLLLIELDLRVPDVPAALALARDAVAAIPDNPRLLDALGRAQMAAGDRHQALDAFTKVAALERRSPLPQLRLAEAYATLRDAAAARASLERAIAIAPDYLPARRAQARFELASGRPDLALAAARAAGAHFPDRSVGAVMTGDVLASQRQWEAAAGEYRGGLKREQSAELAVKLHDALENGKKTGEAAAFAEDWLKRHPDDPIFYSYLADRQLTNDDLVGAESNYLAVVKLQPQNAIAFNNLAWVALKLNKSGALAFAQRANELQPRRPAFLDTLASAQAQAGNTAKAIESERQAVALAPAVPAYRLALAKLYLKAGEKKLAEPELSQLAKLGSKFSGQAEVDQLLKSL